MGGMPAAAGAGVRAGAGQVPAVARGGAGAAPAGTISTAAGGIGGPEAATNVAMTPCGVAFVGGHLYIADSPRTRTPRLTGAVREMSPGTGLLSTLAGTHVQGPAGDRGPAT